MSGYSQYVLKKLESPNELVDKGRYDLDQKLRLKYNDLDIETMELMMERKYESDYQLYWKSLNQQKRGDEVGGKDHECILDEKIFRCKICGRCLKWTVYGIVKDLDPFEQRMKKLYIDYFKYESILHKINKQIELKSMISQEKIFSIRNFTQFSNASQMRDFVYFVLCLPLGYGFRNQIQAYRERYSVRLREKSQNYLQTLTNLQQTYSQIEKLTQNGLLLPSQQNYSLPKPTSNFQPTTSFNNLLTVANSNNPQTGNTNTNINSAIQNNNNNNENLKESSNTMKEVHRNRRSIENFLNDKRLLPPASIKDLHIEGEQHPDLEFFGDFECANFQHVFYDPKNMKVQIILKADTNTDGFTSWFYFGVKVKTNEPLRLTFEILNCRKEKSVFQQGMNVCIARLNDNMVYNNFNNNVRYWRRDMAFDIKYEQSTFPRKVFRRTPSLRVLPVTDFTEIDHTFVPESQAIEERCAKIIELGQKGIDVNAERERTYTLKLKEKKFIKNYYHGLSFIYQFQINSKDSSVLFSQAIPYSFSNLIEFIENIEANIKQQNPLFRYSFDSNTRIYTIDTFNLIYEKIIIGASNIGLPITELQITAPNSQRALNMAKRPYIFILARQHPNETPASFVCQGFIKFIISSEPEAVALRQMFIFKIIPMVNPDGVVIGNSRSSINGIDLNRSWEFCDSNRYPEIFCIKQRMQSLNDDNKCIYMFLDLHGHSSKSGSFLLCSLKEEASNLEWAKVRLFPKIIAENCKFFDISSCKYSFLPVEKNCCAREVAWRDLKVEHSYTLETSFFGSKNVFQGCTIGEDLVFDPEDQTVKHFSVSDYEYIGQQVCKSILQFSACVTLMLEQATQVEKIDVDEEAILTGQLLPEGLEIPLEELNKLNDQQLQKKLTQNLSNYSGTDSPLARSQQLSRIQSQSDKSPKQKKNLKSASIAISQMLRLKQLLEEKEKAKETQLFSDQRIDSFPNSSKVSKNDLEPEELQSDINQQNDSEYGINTNIDQINTSFQRNEDQTKKNQEEKKQGYYMGGTLIQQLTQTNAQNTSTNKSTEKSALSKFQQYVQQTKDKIKVLFALKKGLDWHKFYDSKDADDLKEFKDKQQMIKEQQKQAKEAKNEKTNASALSQLDSVEGDNAQTNDNLNQKEENNESDSEPEDDCKKRFKTKGSKDSEGSADSDEELGNLSKLQKTLGEDGSLSLSLSQRQLNQQLQNKQQQDSSVKINIVPSIDCLDLVENGGGESGDTKLKRNMKNLARNKTKTKSKFNISTLEDEEFMRNEKGYGASSLSQQQQKVLLPTSKFIFGQSVLFRPSTQKIKLKSPFLPSQDEVFEAYSLKSPQNLRNLQIKKQNSENHSTMFFQISLAAQMHNSSQTQSNYQILSSENKNEDSKFKFNLHSIQSSLAILGSSNSKEQETYESHPYLQNNSQFQYNPINPNSTKTQSSNLEGSLSQKFNMNQNQQKSEINNSDSNINITGSSGNSFQYKGEIDEIQEHTTGESMIGPIFTQSSPNGSQSHRYLKLNIQSLSVDQSQKDYSTCKFQKTSKPIESMQNPLSDQSPLLNSIYGGLIADIQKENTSSQQKPSQKQNIFLTKIKIPSQQNSSTITSSQNKTIVTYRPLSGVGTHSTRYLKDLPSPTSSLMQKNPRQNIERRQNEQFDSKSIVGESLSPQIIQKSPSQEPKQINLSQSQQPSFRIKQNNVKKAYLNFIDQQEQAKFEQELQLKQKESQNNIFLRKTSFNSSSLAKFSSPVSQAQSKVSIPKRNSNIIKQTFPYNS